MKSKGTTQRIGLINRLLKGSLILSCLGIISSRLISFFKASVFSYLLVGGTVSDAALENGAIGTAVKKHRLNTRLVRAVKTWFSLSVENSVIVKRYRIALNRLIYTPISTFGAFFATLGIYICIVYFIKLYGFNAQTTVSISSLYIGGVVVLFSIPLLLSRKSLVGALYSSVFVRTMLSGLIDLDAYTGEKQHGAVGTALMAGFSLGFLCFFCGEVKVLLLLLAVVYLLVVLHSPEAGLVSVIAAFPFCERYMLCTLISVAFASYLIKVLRGKRNLHLKTSNIFALMLGLCFLFELFGGGGKTAWFALCMTAAYLLAANLINTQKLLNKCANVFTVGLGVVVTVFAVQVFVDALNGAGWGYTLTHSCSVFASGKQLSCYLLLMLPFVYCKSGGRSFLSKAYSYALVIACIIYSVLNGDTVYAILTAIAATLFLAVKDRKIFRPFVMCFGVPVSGLYFAAVPISFGDMGFYETVSGWVAALRAALDNFITGTGMSALSVSLVFAGDSHSMFLQTFIECGAAGLLLLLLAVVFALQRVYARLGEVDSVNRNITAAAGASALIGLVIGMGTNLWADKDTCLIFWLCLGLAGAAFEIRKEKRRGNDDEQDV